MLCCVSHCWLHPTGSSTAAQHDVSTCQSLQCVAAWSGCVAAGARAAGAHVPVAWLPLEALNGVGRQRRRAACHIPLCAGGWVAGAGSGGSGTVGAEGQFEGPALANAGGGGFEFTVSGAAEEAGGRGRWWMPGKSEKTRCT